MSLSAVIRDARDRLGISQAELAERLGLSTGTVAGWELAAYRPRMNRLRSISKVLRVPYAELLDLAIKEAAA